MARQCENERRRLGDKPPLSLEGLGGLPQRGREGGSRDGLVAGQLTAEVIVRFALLRGVLLSPRLRDGPKPGVVLKPCRSGDTVEAWSPGLLM